MKINFQNVGPIVNGDIELGNLTILAGGNNTGKTYITYMVFGLLTFLKNDFGLHLLARDITNNIREDNKSSILFTAEMLRKVIETHVEEFDESDFARIFSCDDDRFKNSKIKLIFNDNDLNPTSPEELNETIKFRGYEIVVNIKPNIRKRDWQIEVSINKDLDNTKENYVGASLIRSIKRIIGSYFYSLFFPRPYLSTSERLGIALFYKDLDSNRNSMVEYLQQMKSKSNEANSFDPFEFLEKATSRFAFPVHENINRIRSLNSIQKEKSIIDDLDLSLYISNMMGGTYKVIEDEIVFSNNKRAKNKMNFPVHLGSSSLRTLADVFFYLKHSARPNDLLMIDEPESHLTPQNQIIFVRMIAAAISKGIKVYLTTHSDYIIKEINNLIMLSKVLDSDFNLIEKKYGYKNCEVLNIDTVQGYLCSKGNIEHCPKNEFGLVVSNIDDAIDDLNQRTQDIAELLHNQLN